MHRTFIKVYSVIIYTSRNCRQGKCVTSWLPNSTAKESAARRGNEKKRRIHGGNLPPRFFCRSNNRAGFSISAFGTRGPSRAECHIDEHRRPVPARLLGRQEYVIGCQMTEISIKDGPIVIKTKRTSPISLSGRLFGTSFSLIYNDDNVSSIRRRRRLSNHCPSTK